jgi:hypothetical protein
VLNAMHGIQLALVADGHSRAQLCCSHFVRS